MSISYGLVLDSEQCYRREKNLSASPFQAILTAGFIPIIVDLVKVDDELRTDKQKIEREILSQGRF